MPKRTKQEERHLDLGKKLDAFIQSGYVSKKDAFLFSFIKGVLGGVGAFIGGTIVIALLLWILSGFDEVPLISDFVKSIQNSLNSSR